MPQLDPVAGRKCAELVEILPLGNVGRDKECVSVYAIGEEDFHVVYRKLVLRGLFDCRSKDQVGIDHHFFGQRHEHG